MLGESRISLSQFACSRQGQHKHKRSASGWVALRPTAAGDLSCVIALHRVLSVAWQLGQSFNDDLQHSLTVTALPYSFFYSGLARRKSALSLIWLSIMATGLISFQWFFWGYSLSFSHSAGKFIGDLENIGFRNVLAAPSVGSTRIPDLLFAVYQGMFAAIT